MSNDELRSVKRTDLALDLRVVIGSCRTQDQLDRASLPHIDRWLAGRNATRSDLPALLEQAISQAEEPYRQFFTILLPFPYVPGVPWLPLKCKHEVGRGEAAARTVFDVGWDACTREGKLLDEYSRRELAELHLADQLLELPLPKLPAPAAVNSDTGSSVPAGLGSTPPASRRVMAALASLMLVGCLVAGLWTRATSGPSATDRGGSTQRRRCTRVGKLDSNAAAAPGSAAIADRLRRLAASGKGIPSVVCPLGPAMLRAQLTIQEVASGITDLPAALIVGPPGTDIYLPAEAYAAYRRAGGGEHTEPAQEAAGYPSQLTHFPDGHSELQTTKGSLLIQAAPEMPYFWIPGRFVPFWRAHSELGFPTSTPTAELRQGFQHGYVDFLPTPGRDPVQLLADPGAELPPQGQLNGHIVRQSDGVSWWIDRNGQRWWIPTTAAWSCLGGERAVRPGNLPSYALNAIPFSGRARCGKSH